MAGFWKTYDEDTLTWAWDAPKQVIEAAMAELPITSWLRVLDIGVGTGQASRVYLKAGAQVVGLDASAEALAQAEKNNYRFHLLRRFDLNEDRKFSEAGALDETFHVILSSGALHFSKNLKSTLHNIEGLLVPGGICSFTLIPKQNRTFSEHTYLYTEEEVRALVASTGLILKTCRSFLAYYEQGDTHSPVYYLILTARKTGILITPPTELQNLDRTGCVDRNRVQEVFLTPLLEGPLTTTQSDDRVAIDRACNEFEQAVLQTKLTETANQNQLPWPGLTFNISKSEGGEGRVLALFAHPDDEVIFAGGTLRAISARAPQYSTDIVLATSGDRGRNPDHLALAKMREAESTEAAQKIGAAAISFLRLEDHGKYKDSNRSRPLRADESLELWDPLGSLAMVVDAIRRSRPTILLSFDSLHDPNYSLHAHHLAVGKLALVAFHQAANPIYEGSKLEPWIVQRHYVSIAPHHRGARSCRVEIDPLWKLDVIKVFKSQAFSVERVQRALQDRLPLALVENWWLVQARDCIAGPQPLPGIEARP